MKQRKRVAKKGRKARPVRQRSRRAEPKGLSIMASVEESERPYATIEEVLGLYRPRKQPVTLRLDADVLAWFKKQGRGYQTRINHVLRTVMREQMRET
jgi:uncharacterized protein (DUF4415 family)